MGKLNQTDLHRRSTRLPEYDYTQPGAYFITICVKDRRYRLGAIIDEEMVFSKEGEILQDVWEGLPKHYPNIKLDEFVVMPNHVHGIIWILEIEEPFVGAGLRPARNEKRRKQEGQRPSPTKKSKAHGLPEIVRAFKSFSSRQINEFRHTKGSKFWQRSFYDHIIRDEEDLCQHRKYIQENVLKWCLDEYHSPR